MQDIIINRTNKKSESFLFTLAFVISTFFDERNRTADKAARSHADIERTV